MPGEITARCGGHRVGALHEDVDDARDEPAHPAARRKPEAKIESGHTSWTSSTYGVRHSALRHHGGQRRRGG